jgi:hypothetical protein
MVIKFILINLFISLPILSSNASITSNNQGLSHLIAALTKIDKPKSLKVAKELTSNTPRKVLTILMTHTESFSKVNVIRVIGA